MSESKRSLEEGQIVLCTVTKIIGTIVFVSIDDYHLEGTITFSEIAPGRIRNIRDYASPGRKIVCKVLKKSQNGIHLSLRRVKLKEKNELMEELKRERSFSSMLKTVVKEGAEGIITKIKEGEGLLSHFIEELKKDAKLLEKYVLKEEAKKIAEILSEKKEKETVLKKGFSLSNKSQSGILAVKKVIKEAISQSECNDCEISYIAAGKYLIKIKTKNLKQADTNLKKIIENLEIISKKEGCIFKEER